MKPRHIQYFCFAWFVRVGHLKGSQCLAPALVVLSSRNMYPARFWITWDKKLKDELIKLRIGFKPLGQMDIRDVGAVCLTIYGLSYGVLRVR